MQVLLEDDTDTAVRDAVPRTERVERRPRARRDSPTVDTDYGEVGHIDEDRVRSLEFTVMRRETHTLDRVEDLAEMAAIGLGLPQGTFTDAGKYG